MLCVWAIDGNHGIHGTLVLGTDQLQSLIKHNFLNSFLLVTSAKFVFLIENHACLFKAIDVLFVCTTHSFILSNNAKPVHRRHPYPTFCVELTSQAT